MEKTNLITQLSDFLKTEPACQQAITCLDKKAEIAIRVGGSVELCVQHKDGGVSVEERKAYAADFIFSATPEAIEVLISEKGLNAGQLGVKLVKQIISRDIQVSMPGSLFLIPKRGYLNIVTVGGVEFFNELKEHNLASPAKIIEALRKLKKS